MQPVGQLRIVHVGFPSQQRERLAVAHRDRKLFVGEPRGIHSHAFRIVEQQLLQRALRQRKDVGNVEPINRAGLHADRSDQDQPAHRFGTLVASSAATQPPIEQPITSS